MVQTNNFYKCCPNFVETVTNCNIFSMYLILIPKLTLQTQKFFGKRNCAETDLWYQYSRRGRIELIRCNHHTYLELLPKIQNFLNCKALFKVRMRVVLKLFRTASTSTSKPYVSLVSLNGTIRMGNLRTKQRCIQVAKTLEKWQ